MSSLTESRSVTGRQGGRRMPRLFGEVGPALPAFLLIVFFFVAPVVALLLRSVLEPVPGLQNYETLLGSATYIGVFANTFIVSTVVTAAALAIGFPVAWALVVMPMTWSRIVFAILILSMWTNLLARTYAWMVLLQRTGLINKMLMAVGLTDEPLTLVNNLTGVTIGMTYIMLPFVILPLYGVISNIDKAVLRAAALCGANRWQALTRVLLPLAAPGMAAGGLMVFVMSLGYFVTPALLGGTSNMMLAELIAQLVQSLTDWGLGSAAAFVLLLSTLVLYGLMLKFFGTSRLGGQ
ncbi:ABC transporter permease [Fulvimarina endophytica]|uniref:ABC transporter permease n=1 Tax=Fulvimarina endophytica TaxID=2293836 RepID=A0A371WZ63_9HYPH|nr:ABC transporter permease [Fulvimarina endophytica]